jgi:preprotein translocase subunit SecE
MSAIDRLKEFRKDVWVEAGKVSWPTREELRDSTAVVIVTVLLVTAFIGLVDQVLNRAVGLLFH